MTTRQERLTELGRTLMAGVRPTTDVPIPTDLSRCELGEWLEGAGFIPQTNVEINGEACQVWWQCSIPEWPSWVTVVTSADGEVTTNQFWSEDDVPQDTHDYDPTCRCQSCVDEFRVRYEPKGY